MITYKFRLYPNKKQQTKLWEHANKLNWLYNYFLQQRIDVYEKEKRSIKKVEQQVELVKLKQSDSSLKEIYSQVLQQVTDRLDKTYKAFFNKGYGFPKFRSCKKFFGICYPQSGFKIENDKVVTKVYGAMKFTKHRDIKGNVKQIRILTQNGKWYLCITTDYEKEKVESGQMVGVDVGISNIAALSDNTIIPNQTHSKYFDKQINLLKSRRDKNYKKGSRRFKFLSRTVQRLYDVKTRKVHDFLHKTSHSLSSKFDTIVVENLNLKKMSESNKTGLNRELRNSQIAKFMSYLKYKTFNVIEVNPRNTSKMCNRCGKLHTMPLYQRTMKCTCGNEDDRDVNATKNIYCLGQAYLKLGRTVEIQEALCFS